MDFTSFYRVKHKRMVNNRRSSRCLRSVTFVVHNLLRMYGNVPIIELAAREITGRRGDATALHSRATALIQLEEWTADRLGSGSRKVAEPAFGEKIGWAKKTHKPCIARLRAVSCGEPRQN